MLYKTKYLLASTALLACMLQAAPSFGDTVVRETVTESPGSTTVKKTVTETMPDSTTVHTTVTTEQPGTTTTETRWRTTKPGEYAIDFMGFDLNNDGVMSRDEIGQMLFRLYDTDNNNVIDNNEYERRNVVTVMPMQKDTVVTYDFDGDGQPDETTYTYETFMQDTMLARFDMNHDGLSAHEFTDLNFLAADVNRDHAIDLKEWQGTYTSSIDKANKLKARLNK
ncbi:MAG: hypothetical protein V1721_06210 [Pseudomonadota bacterium]